MKLVTSSETFGWSQPKTERGPAEDLGAARRPSSVAQKLVPGRRQRRRCSRQCSQISAVPASSLEGRYRRRSAAAAVSLRNWRQLPFNGTCAPAASAAACHVSSGFTSVCCTAAIALLCRADRFSPSTLSVTMRRVLCAVCPMLRHRQCGCIALRVRFATAYRKRRGGSKRRQTSTSFWRGLYFTVQNAVPALLCGGARAA